MVEWCGRHSFRGRIMGIVDPVMAFYPTLKYISIIGIHLLAMLCVAVFPLSNCACGPVYLSLSPPPPPPNFFCARG